MACLRPIPASQSEDSVTLLNERRALDLEAQYLELDCKSCEACRARRARDWAIRCHHEAQMHTRLVGGTRVPNNCFITLTYNDEHLPKDGALNKRHWQNFMKKLRNRFGPVRFLMCGEYGSTGTRRPHFHACLFGIDFHDDRVEYFSEGDKRIWNSDDLAQCWGKGFTSLAPLNFATASYTAGYVLKKLKTEQAENDSFFTYIGKDLKVHRRPQEFILMSLKPGIGAEWFDRFWRDVFPQDEVHIGGRIYKAPRYYLELLQDYDPVMYDDVMCARRSHVASAEPTTENQLRARREIFAAKNRDRKPRQ